MNIPKPFTRREQKRSLSSLRGSTMSMSNKKKSCVNMEELMQFEAARRRALSQMDPGVEENPFAEFVSHRVFINQIDTFNGSHLAQYLCNVRREMQKEDAGEDDEDLKQQKLFDEADEDEQTAQLGEMDFSQKGSFSSETYQIMGSLQFINNTNYERPEDIFELLDNENKSQFLDKVLTCGYIIYDITSDLYCHPKQVEEAKWVLESIHKRLEMFKKNQPKAFAKYTHCRVFILISTLLTWAKTKPISEEDPTLPFTERDYRKRKPHPNYKIHCELEKKVIELGKKYPKHLRTIVIGSGIPYGHEEDVLHFLFKMAWQDSPFLPIFKPGNNIIPVIHIDSLAGIVHLIMENFPEKYKYIIATDPHSVTLKKMVKLLAKRLGNGQTKLVDKEEAFLFPDIQQRNYDMLTVSINIVPGFILENPLLRWGTDLPFEGNVPSLLSQFKAARKLAAVKIFIHGPPASGKSFLAQRLCALYDVPLLNEKNIVEETINTLKEKIKMKTEKAEKVNEEKIEIEGDEALDEEEKESDDDDDDDGEDLEVLKQTLRDIEENLEKNGNNKLDEDYVLRFFKEKLSSNVCMNKGYVIDGYPESMEQTKILYAPLEEEVAAEEEDGDEEQGGDISRMCNLSILPAYVESLDASDEYLINKVIRLPEVNLTQFEEHEMCRRLTEFRAFNTDENTPLIFYDEMDVHPMIYNIENDPDVQMKPTFEAIVNHVGPPRNYKKEIPSLEVIFQENEAENRAKKLENLKAQREELRKTVDDRRQHFENWMFLKNQELEMEEKALILMGMPLRHYLMKYIFPCLTRGLVEVARLRPDDPVDFLSEFLFRENPEGKMFQPNYDEREEKLSQAIREFESTTGRTSSRSTKKSFSTEKSLKSDAVSRVTDYKCSYASTSSKSKGSKSKSVTSSKSGPHAGKAHPGRSSERSSEKSSGVCTCQKSPSLSTCSSDRTPSTASSCTCSVPEPCEPCEPCDTPDTPDTPNTPQEVEDSCKCPCQT